MTAADHRLGLAMGLIDSLVEELVKRDPKLMHEWEMSEFAAWDDPDSTPDELEQGRMLRASIHRAWEREANPSPSVADNENSPAQV